MAIDTADLHSRMKLVWFCLGFHFIANMAVDAMHAFFTMDIGNQKLVLLTV